MFGWTPGSAPVYPKLSGHCTTSARREFLSPSRAQGAVLAGGSGTLHTGEIAPHLRFVKTGPESFECRGIAGAPPSENRPARHRVAQARVLGVAAWRTGPLQHGARTHDCRRGRQAAEPGARLPGGGTHTSKTPLKLKPLSA